MPTRVSRARRTRLFAILLVSLGIILLAVPMVLAQDGGQEDTPTPPAPVAQGSPLHPDFPLLDANGENVVVSGEPASTLKTCGTCHDAAFITSHNGHGSHTDEWNALIYASTTQVDLDLRTWITVTGGRFTGTGNFETDGQTVEMDCFLCHTVNPDNTARVKALRDGHLDWSNSASLLSMNVVLEVGGQYRWNPAAFDEQGNVTIAIQDPTSNNCGQCHGVVHGEAQEALTLPQCSSDVWTTMTTGQIFSPQRILNSGLNYEGKAELDRTFDIHAERVIECVDCHYAQNNPVYHLPIESNRPEHLTFDPRRIDLGDYIQRPIHTFSTERGCVDCHDAEPSHQWLPYQDRHMEAVACESCHIPTLYGPALAVVDWTVLTTTAGPVREYRGGSGRQCTSGTSELIVGYQPVLLENEDGKLAPHNMITAWYWVQGDDEQPVPLPTLTAAWLEDGAYPEAIVTLFDANRDGLLDMDELKLDSAAKIDLIRQRLIDQGVDNPHMAGVVETEPIYHSVTHGAWAIRECETCHSDDSRLKTAFVLADFTPDGAIPTLPDGLDGSLTRDDGDLLYTPDTSKLYLLGSDSVPLIDWLGALMFVGTLGVIGLHSTLRVRAAKANQHAPAKVERVYMYSVYERQWHWLQTAVIVGLLFTGLIIHKPQLFGMFSFRYIVEIHNVLALILVVNAALSAFYHLASGEIKQFLPEPKGFFHQAIQQATFYVRGIFKGDPHPFEKSAEHKMNPLQQMTYLAILNVLLPLQVITGALMWGAQTWPKLTESLGGLPYLAPVHTLAAWLFATFIVAHVYLTTTGHTPLAGIRAMMLGWDDIEQPDDHPHQPTHLNEKESAA